MAQLYFKYGAMGSSKTANALMARFNYEERGQKTLLVKPRMDQPGRRPHGPFPYRSGIPLRLLRRNAGAVPRMR